MEKGILFLTDTKAPRGLAVPRPGQWLGGLGQERARVGWGGNTVVHLASVFLSPQLRQFPFPGGCEKPKRKSPREGAVLALPLHASPPY